MNPYARHLGDRDALEAIADTARRLKSISEALGAERLERAPAPGKWSAREILCHLADCELAFAFRLRQALAEDHHVIQPREFSKPVSHPERGTMTFQALIETMAGHDLNHLGQLDAMAARGASAS